MPPAVVGVTPLNDTTGYGPLSANLDNTAGNALMVFVAVGSDNVSGYLPRTAVGDDAHNWWIFAGSEANIFPKTNRRMDIWVCPNARVGDANQGTNISVSSSAVYAGIAATVVEVSGFPTYSTVDFIAPGGGFGTSVTLNGTATVADYVFGACLIAGSGTPGFAITRPSGWTAIGGPLTGGTASSIADMSSLEFSGAWESVSAGAVSATWNWTGSENSSAVMIGFKQSPPAPSQPNANWPSLKIEAALGWEPGNLVGTMPAWTDISTRAQDDQSQVVMQAKRGRDYELSQPAAGSLAILLDNHDAAFNPVNTGSPYYPDILPEVPVRVSATWNGQTYGIGYSYASKWPQSFPNPQWGMTPYQGNDAISVASQGQMPSALGGQVLADFPYAYYPFGEYYDSAHGSLFGNVSRTNLKPMIGYSPGTAAALTTGQEMNLAGDSATGIGVTGLNAPTDIDSGYGAFLRDYELPDLGTDNVTLEFWTIVPPITGTSSFLQLLALTYAPWNYLPTLPEQIGASEVFSVLYHSTGATNDSVGFWLQSYDANIGTLGYSLLTPGDLIYVAVTITYNSGTSEYTITGFVNGGQVGASTTSGVTLALPVTGMLTGTCVPLSGVGTTANFSITQLAVYPWALPAARIAAHYNSGNTADSGDALLDRLGKLAAWSGLGLPVLGAPSPPSPLIGNADQIQGSALADTLYDVSVDEGGMYYAPADAVGAIWYASRTSLYNRTPKYVFGDLPSAGEIPYDFGSGFDYSDAFLFNIISSQRTISASQQIFIANGQAEAAQFNAYGATAVTEDLASENEFMPRGPMEQPIETTSDQDAFDRANWSLAKYKQPHLRANQIRLDPASNPNLWSTALAVEQGDVVTVNRRPMGGVEISLNCIVQQVEHNVGPNVWNVVLTLAPYFPENAVIQLDNASFNELGDGCLGW